MTNADQPANTKKIQNVKRRIENAKEIIRKYKNNELTPFEEKIKLDVAKVIAKTFSDSDVNR